ncbi:unnamed protein product [Didymodactylos carnosus]|uniref:Uncharacterized protein n=1 Tax=Didymodactylos carnosus TaxID=1234261 RepID=A0A813NG84_9BILA|nr:unnamed protein product [Didymodactylos carnosus]CAF0736976.1 unnamed protein product [Didymodactylos carnosus]CAF3494821.1 unnamed protein product [Didymodactylos carnosus]CAF3514957.1 unnamed protein product [Didymodactylos carnosus]
MTTSPYFTPDQENEEDNDNNKDISSSNRINFIDDKLYDDDNELNVKNHYDYDNNICLPESTEETFYLLSSVDDDIEKKNSEKKMMFISDNIIINRPSYFVETSLAKLHGSNMNRKISSYNIDDDHYRLISKNTVEYQQQQNGDKLLSHVNRSYPTVNSQTGKKLYFDSSLSSDDNLIETNNIYGDTKSHKRYTTKSDRQNKLNSKMRNHSRSTSDDESYGQNKGRKNKQRLPELRLDEFMQKYHSDDIKKSFGIPQNNFSDTDSLSSIDDNSRKQECSVTPIKQGQLLPINDQTKKSNNQRENDQQHPSISRDHTFKSSVKEDIVDTSAIKKLQSCFIPKPQEASIKKPTVHSSDQSQSLSKISTANHISLNSLKTDIIDDTLNILQPINESSFSSLLSSPLQVLFDIARTKNTDRLSKIESIRTYVEQQLGITAFLTIYKLLKSQHPIDMKQKPFCYYIPYTPHLCALIMLESEEITRK